MDIPFNRGAIRAGECISQGWDLIKDNYWLFLGITLVGMIIAGCIPCVSLFLFGPISVGMYLVMFTQMRRQPVEFGLLFKGFEKFVPAMVLGLIEALPGIIIQVARVGLQLGIGGLGNMGKGGRDFNFFAPSDMGPALASGIVIIALVAGLALIVFSIFWQVTFKFALPLLTDNEGIGLGDCIKLSARAGWSNFGGIFVLAILEGLLVLAGIIALCVGVFFVMPIIWAANALAFRMVFPDGPRNTPYNAPPNPEYYGGSFGQGT
jgi:hypothetical protein